MPGEIIFVAGGDHRFDLNHLRRQGGEDLVRLLLREAGHEAHVWRVRVEKKFACGAGTRPVSVVGSKPWCCYVKVKPGDNNSGHFCSLLMPDGLNGESIYEAIKGAEERVNRSWHTGVGERPAINGAAPTVAPTPAAAVIRAPQAPPDEVANEAAPPEGDTEAEVMATDDESTAEGPGVAKTPLRNWSRDEDKVRLTLLAVEEMAQAGPYASKTEFVTALAERLGWQGVNRHEMGGVFTSLVRRGYLDPVYQGSKDLGYVLTDLGRQQIRDLLPRSETGAGDSPRPPDPAGDLLLDLAGIVREYSASAERLQAIRARRAELMAEIQRLDAEARELSGIANDPEVRALVERLRRGPKKPPAG